ncbi:TonB-dependent receptor [Exilibacterium tricleocarpae]|uniref:TonB-dependent receptor n=1 Tax=Exilibacterium tricleocarpae TaxID=2591008 RepID=A0A545TFT9_9GAMM|nr:TonB-dependent receptor [Exilibacterium tricleocarpae]TQV76046.1 TonB-dependent receptor [Exilibacterium tricleocarpae]
MEKFLCRWCLVSAAVSTNLAMAHGSLEEVTVTGRQANLIGEAISASEGRVSQDDLAVRPLLRAGEILEVVPGMVATQHSGSGKANQYFLRGFNLDHGTDFATKIDAMPVNMRSHGHGQGYTDLNFIIPELVSEITYKKGSYYADVGDFSGTGSAHITSASDLNTSEINIGLGEDSFGRILVTGKLPVGSGRLIYGVEHQTYDGPWEDISEDIDKTNIWLKQVWGDKTEQFHLTLMAYDNDWNSADQIPERAVRQGLISDLGSIDDSVGGSSSRYSLSAHWQRQSAVSQIKASLYAIQYDMDLWSNFSYFTNPEGDQFQQIDERTIYGWDIAYTRGSKWFDRPVSNLFGTQFRLDDIDEVGLLSSRERRRTGVSRMDAVEQYSASLYWENTLQWNDHLRSVLGVRYDYHDFDVTTLAAADPRTLPLNEGTESDDIVTASLSLVYTFDDSYETYVSIGQGFHSNDARGTTISADPNSGEPLDTVDALVDTLGYEFGVRAFLTDKLNASIALWRLEIDSELLFVGDEGTTEDTGVGSRRKGVELTTYYQFNDHWTLDIEYAYTDARLDEELEGYDDIPGALESVLSAGIHTKINDRFYSHLRLRHFGEYPLEGGQTADSSTLVNLRLGYEVHDKVKLTLDILNLLDSDDQDINYFYESQLQGEAEPVADKHFHVFEPIRVRMYLGYVF